MPAPLALAQPAAALPVLGHGSTVRPTRKERC